MNCCEKPDCQDVHCPGRPVSVARIGRKDYTREELPPTMWRQQIKSLAGWVGLALLGWLVWCPLLYLAFVVK
jgi:hypothetical protein